MMVRRGAFSSSALAFGSAAAAAGLFAASVSFAAVTFLLSAAKALTAKRPAIATARKRLDDIRDPPVDDWLSSCWTSVRTCCRIVSFLGMTRYLLSVLRCLT